MTDRRVLGVDGGGSKTLVVAIDEAPRIVGTAAAGGINPLDNSGWREELERALRPLLGLSGLGAIVAALPSYGEVEAVSAAERAAVAACAGDRPQLVLNDVDAAQIGAFAGGAGILLLSGTGSMAWARDAQGRSFRSGGWGEIVGDEGSAYWIGRRILGRVSQGLDGRAAPTALAAAVLAALGVAAADAMNGIEGWTSGLVHPRSAIAALAPLATRLAEAGDRAATEIVAEAAEELARHVRALERRVGPSLPWSYAGGSFASRTLLGAVSAQLGRPALPPRLPPIGGALLRAAQLADWPTGDAWIDRLRGALPDAAFGHNDNLETTA